MVMAKVLTAKADLPSTVVAVLAFTQAAAAAVGVLAVTRIPAGLLDVPTAELVIVNLCTFAVAIVLALGCLRILTGASSRLAIIGSAASLVISAYWILLRPQAEGFPDIAVAYAVLPGVTLGMLAVSRLLRSHRVKHPKPSAAFEDSTRAEDTPQTSQTPRPPESAGDPEEDEALADYEPVLDAVERPWEVDAQRLGLASKPAHAGGGQTATLVRAEDTSEDADRA